MQFNFSKKKKKKNVLIADAGRAALIVNKKKLYSLGESERNLMFKNEEKYKPALVENLFLREIQAIATGCGHGVLLDESGLVCTFGNDSPVVVRREVTELISSLKNVHWKRLPKITMVCCGDNFTLALSAEKKVWIWGTLLDTTYSAATYHVNNVCGIAAGGNYAALIDVNGKVYTWGDNVFGTLGNGTFNSVLHPTEVKTLADHKVVHITCLQNTMTAINSDGTLFCWGANFTPVPTSLHFNSPVRTIIGCKGLQFWIAECSDGKLHIWGKVNAREIFANVTPLELANPLNKFADNTMPPVFNVQVRNKSLKNKIDEKIKDLIINENTTFLNNTAHYYNSKDFSDVIITLSDEKLFGHKYILATKSEFFKRLVCGELRDEVNLSNHNPDVVRAYVRYLYASSFEELDISLIPEMYSFAQKDNKEALIHFYKDKWQSTLGKEKAVIMFVAALNFDVKELIKVCAKYIVENINELALTPEFKSLGADVIHNLFDYGLQLK